MSDSAMASTARWVDTRGRAWDASIEPARIVLRGEDGSMTVERDRWPTDLYVTTYQGGFLVRIDTFDQSLQFILAPELASPLLEAIGAKMPPSVEHSAVREIGGAISPATSPWLASSTASPGESDDASRGLLWPKVSPLAVWALILSALTFIPMFGLVPAAGAVVLLILHRATARKNAAMRHSRRMCLAAGVILLAGVVVNVTAWRETSRRHGRIAETSLTAAPEKSMEKNWGMIACAIVVVILSLSVHEAGHAITAWWLGDGLAKAMGRVTLNPLSHIDPIGTVLLPILLAMAGAPVFGYARPVPVQVSMLPRYRRAHILISIAGPGSNLLLACLALMLLLGLSCSLRIVAPEATVFRLASLDPASPVIASGFTGAATFATVCTFLKLCAFINLALAFFNMFPIPPLDGSWVLEHLFPRSLGPLYAMVRPYGFLIFVVALYSDVFDYLWPPLILAYGSGMAMVAAATGW